jgi:hypothetical protein
MFHLFNKKKEAEENKEEVGLKVYGLRLYYEKSSPAQSPERDCAVFA